MHRGPAALVIAVLVLAACTGGVPSRLPSLVATPSAGATFQQGVEALRGPGTLMLVGDPVKAPVPLTIRFAGADGTAYGPTTEIGAGERIAASTDNLPGRVRVLVNGAVCDGTAELREDMTTTAVLAYRDGWCTITVQSIEPTAPPSVSPSASPVASATVGQFRLDFRLAKLSWRAGDRITGAATLSSLGGAPTVLYGAGTGLTVFDYAEVGGDRRASAISTADCAPHPIDAATPIVAPIGSTGGYDLSGPSGEWMARLTGAGAVELPVGTWDVTARASFYEGECGASHDNVSVTLRVRVDP